MEDDSKRIRQEKEFKSFCKKVRQNSLIWFDALSKTKKYDLFYEWKQAKYDSVDKKTTCIRDWGMKLTFYPAILKHFIRERKKFLRYQPSKTNLRSSSIDFILKNKK